MGEPDPDAVPELVMVTVELAVDIEDGDSEKVDVPVIVRMPEFEARGVRDPELEGDTVGTVSTYTPFPTLVVV